MRIVHVFRSPVGGLFRHVRDLVQAQAGLGHEIGLVCDSSTGGAAAEVELAELSKFCSQGILRISISTLPGPSDFRGIGAVADFAKSGQADVIHGHGAKGGLYGRLAAHRLGLKSVYTPHGGSLHYDWLHFPGFAFLGAERALRATGAGLIFVCDYERLLYDRKIGLGNAPHVVIHNGLWPAEFAAVPPLGDATDLLFVGELRKLKGVDVLLKALAKLKPEQQISLTIVGEGRDQALFEGLSNAMKLTKQVRFVGRKSIADALPLGHLMVMPSRHESFPYVVLEAIAAAKPIIASAVGGIPELLPAENLCAANDVDALAAKIRAFRAAPLRARERAGQLQSVARNSFTVQKMALAVLNFYQA